MSSKPPVHDGGPSESPFSFASKGNGLDPMLLGSLGVLLAAVFFIIYRLIKFQGDEAAAKRRTEALLAMAEADGRDERREVQEVAGRRRVVRRRVNHDGDDGFAQAMLGQQNDDDFDDEDDASYSGLGASGEKMGKRKAAKLQMKEEKKAMREHELVEREERKRREAEKEKRYEEERRKEEDAEKEEEERIRKEKEEKEKRELEEYLKLKESFAVEEEGYDEVQGEEAENLLKDFLDYITKSKVVNMDELAAHFGLKTDQAINRLHHFLENGQLQGVMDDRGKFIYITEEELEAVAKFINQRGRVSIQELADYSNKLIRIEGEVC